MRRWRCADLQFVIMVELKVNRPDSVRQEVHTDEKRRNIVLGGALIAAAAAAFAFGRHLSKARRLKEMETFVLKADNGTEAHIRPLGCCIQRMPCQRWLVSLPDQAELS